MVLGKRARAPGKHTKRSYCHTLANQSTEPSSRSLRAKRRALATTANDENADPESLWSTQNIVQHDDCMDLEDAECAYITPSKSTQGASSPTNRVLVAGKIASSPIKINEHLIATRTVSSPSLQKVQVATPRTPRHRDALSKKVPITPRHRVIVPGKLFTPQTPRTSQSPSNVTTIYSDARQLFVRSVNPGRLVGREEERQELQAFIDEGIQSNSGRCMYVSGPPGTGKSALVREVCGNLQTNEDLATASINCMSMQSSKDIFGKLIENLSDDAEHTYANEAAHLRNLFLPKKSHSRKLCVVTLDEIDHLITLDTKALYSLFEWSLHCSSRLILIGIANALDLTDRFLPLLKARNLKPQLLPFLPYTVPQIGSVITTKLKSLNSTSPMSTEYVPFIHPTAIQFCAKKVASQTGDLRKAFDIIRRSIDLVENETKQKHREETNSELSLSSPSKAPLGENANLSSPVSPSRSAKKQISLTDSLSRLTPQNAPRATIAHVARVTASAFGNGTTQRLQMLNLQQKAALSALVAFEKKQLSKDIFTTPSKNSGSAPTIRRLYESYCVLCKRENALHPLTLTEFVDVIGSLETLSLVGETGGKGRKGIFVLGLMTPSKKTARAEERKVASYVNEKELESVLEGAGGEILRRLLNGVD